MPKENKTINLNKILIILILITTNAYSKSSYISVDYFSKKIFINHNADKKKNIASLTKMATAAVTLDVIELLNLNKSTLLTVPGLANKLIPNNSPYLPTEKLQLYPGDKISLSDALTATIIASDNVASLTLANFIGSQIRSINNTKNNNLTEFVKQMNILAKNLYMKNTIFKNPHGLDAKLNKQSKSTAKDLAKLAIYVMAKSSYRFYSSQKVRDISYYRHGNKINTQLINTNQLIGISGIDGVKTGSTQKAGKCVIISGSKPTEVHKQQNGKTLLIPKRLIVVVLDHPNRFNVAQDIYNKTWKSYELWSKSGRKIKNTKEMLLYKKPTKKKKKK